MDDVKRALLGDQEAAKRLTEAGVLLPCPCCGSEAKFKKGFPSRQIAHCRQAVVQCKKCGVRTVTHRQLPMERWQDVDRAAIEEWNTRAPILSAGKMEMLEALNDPLTLEQLREMGGDPVYIIAKGMGIAEWNVIKGKDYITLSYDQPTIGFKTVTEGIEFVNGRMFRIDSYGVTWLAYRRPPEGEDGA